MPKLKKTPNITDGGKSLKNGLFPLPTGNDEIIFSTYAMYDSCKAPLLVDTLMYSRLLRELNMTEVIILAVAFSRLVDNRQPFIMRANELRQATGKCDSITKQGVKHLIDLNVLTRTSQEHYLINPLYFWKSPTGSRIEYFDIEKIEHKKQVPHREDGDILVTHPGRRNRRKDILLKKIEKSEAELSKLLAQRFREAQAAKGNLED